MQCPTNAWGVQKLFSPPTTALQESISSALYNKNKFAIFLYFTKNVFVAELHKKQLRSATSAQTNRWAQPGTCRPIIQVDAC